MFARYFNSLKFDYTDSELVNIFSILNTSLDIIPDVIKIDQIENVKKITYEQLNNKSEEILRLKEENIKIKPKNACEAIILAAIDFKIDLTNCIDPLSEYKDRKSTRLNSSHIQKSRMPSSA